MGAVERDIRDRAVESLAEMTNLDVRPMFSGFGFYLDGLLVAAAWDGAFRLRHRRERHWIYEPVDTETLEDPSLLVPMVQRQAAVLASVPEARRRR